MTQRARYFKRFGIAALIFVGVLVLCLRMVGPYVFVVNSIPGQIPLSDQDRQSILNASVERIEPVLGSDRLRVLQRCADRNTDNLALNERSGVVRLSQIVVAKFLLGQAIERCNRLLQEIDVWGRAGSSWSLHKTGDYDFALVWLTCILYEFGDNEAILYPKTKDYLLNTLLTEQGRLNLKVPRTGGLIFDTENHLLMREGSRYLKNQWLKAQGPVSTRLDNDKNGLGDWLEQHLNHMRLKGTYEYNSVPYVTYCLLPLMNLADYAESETIRRLAEAVIDNIALRFSYGSFQLRQCAPFRRQLKYANDPRLRLNRMTRWVQFQQDRTAYNNDLVVFASMFHDYRFPVETYQRLVERQGGDYYACFAHEQKGSPEIYSGGKHYLLTGGGAYRGPLAKVISRPIALLLDDGAEDLDHCIHIKGQGSWKQWNMTGVHRRFAAAQGKLFIPQRYGHETMPGWNAFQANEHIRVAYYQGTDLVILLVLPNIDVSLEDSVLLLSERNPAPEAAKQFQWPVEMAPSQVQTISFDIHANASTWVINAVNGEAPSPMKTTTFETWPFMMIESSE